MWFKNILIRIFVYVDSFSNIYTQLYWTLGLEQSVDLDVLLSIVLCLDENNNEHLRCQKNGSLS